MKYRILMIAAGLLLATGPAMAEDWNDRVTDAAKHEAKIYQQERKLGDGLAILLEEMAAEGERIERSGVVLLEKTQKVEQMSGLQDAAASKLYFASVNLVTPSGQTHKELVTVSPEEAERMKMEAAGSSADEVADVFDGMAGGLLMLGEGLRAGIENSEWREILTSESALGGFSGYRGGNLNEKCATYMAEGDALRRQAKSEGKSEKFQDQEMALSLGITPFGYDPTAMMLGPACMYAVMAGRLKEPTETYKNVRNRAIDDFNKMAMSFGQETIEGYPTERIAVDGMSFKQVTEEGQEIVIERMDLWIDPKYLKRRKMRMEGTIKENGKTREIFIERENRDYRRVGDSVMYEPYREIVRAGGIMNDKQKKELAKAKKELDKMEQQFAAMPASQRQMMERMVGPQIEQLRSMANDGAITMEIVTTDIVINPDLSDDGAFYAMFTGKGGIPGTTGGSLPGGENSFALIQVIQSNLAKLGFEPGPATGQLNDSTRSAISQYQASRGMTVNGLPSSSLAASLQAEVNAL